MCLIIVFLVCRCLLKKLGGLNRAFDPVVLSTHASQAIKQRFVNFVRSLSTVLAFAFCTARYTIKPGNWYFVFLMQMAASSSGSVAQAHFGVIVYCAV